ncbi:MAG: phosphodiester glycosidase family protein [Verrucomicrobiota bacterium]|nr:phosphodiester glycosidase family protein [Verrucomicrobiota bacterium]
MKNTARKISSLLLLASALTPTALADWQVAETQREPTSAAAITHVRYELSHRGESATIDLALFQSKAVRLHVIDNAGGNENLADAMAREKCVAGVNGGYFDPQFRPIGLRIIDSALTSPLVRARLLTGVLVSSARGWEIFRPGEFSRKKKYESAIQCGPFLIDNGASIRGLDDTRSARRTFAAVAKNGEACLGVASALTLAQLADALTCLPAPKIARALNLDGGSSTAFWLRRESGGAVSMREWKNVRDFVGVAPR